VRKRVHTMQGCGGAEGEGEVRFQDPEIMS